MKQTQDHCNKPGLTPIEDALQYLLETISVLTETEAIPLSEAHGRVLAADVISPINVPPHDNSAMDGYALHHLSDVTQPVEIVATVLAGHPYIEALAQGKTVRIMTGAPIPQGASAVVMQEDAQRTGDSVVFAAGVALNEGMNIRRAGEDIRKLVTILPAGRRLRVADCGLLASIGIATVTVVRRLRVALVTTGDELQPPGTPLLPGNIYESNSFTLTPMLQRLGVELITMPAVADDLMALRAAFTQADEQADVVITSGGVSVGEADLTRTVLEELGQLNFWKLAIKPGKPFAFGRLPSSWFIGLPGNPVSALVTLHQLALPLLRTMAGETLAKPLRFNATTLTDLRKSPGRTDYQRAIAKPNEEGQLVVATTGAQGSGVLSSMSQANCYIVLEKERGRVTAGETVTVEVFDEWLA
ncbi:molybdopterin molybdotransferase MoeA [Thalassolituus oleivorans]|uniref:Molybdopterin molybdenumtransferase n=1 Tax=Thalassolituus oleivorans MIL-1 TaxID=1298593 RepID=M5DVU6_9GAMM|nr:molybdopterin molybdotransferase MoeA [Thalassolituus oleivorans]CCU73527.1 Putative molybdopterin biosynthesis protein MoeA [Thalassolituus oleivorans MIL-1]